MTILLYKNGQWLIDGEQPLEGVSLDNLAAILTNPSDGDVVKYDEASGMWTAGKALPPVTATDNGKVLAVANGAWAAQANDIVLNATTAYDDSNQNYNIAITSAIPSASDLESYFNGNRSIVLHFTDVPWVARLQPELKEVDSAMGTYYSFIGEGLGLDYDKLKYVIRFNVNNVGAVSYVGKVYIGDKFIVTLTPTALDYSGTMDHTVAEIYAAYQAGMEIWFRIETSGIGYLMEMAGTGNGAPEATYPSFNAIFIETGTDVMLAVYTSYTNDGTKQTYATVIYSLTPAS